MKSKILNLALILASFTGYLEWGGGNRMFLLQAETEVIPKLFTDFSSAAHPLTLLPLAGQLLLVITLFQKSPGKTLTLLGMAGIGSLLSVMFVIGVAILDIKMVLSTLPFFLIGWMIVKHHFTKKTTWKHRVQAPVLRNQKDKKE